MERNRIARRLVVLALAWVLVPGCVTRQAYQDSLAELDRAKTVNEDLLRKYNEVVQSLKGRPAAGGEISRSSYDEVQAELARLRSQLQSRQRSVPFHESDFERLANVEDEDGGFRLGEELLFNPGEHLLKSSQIPTLDEIAALLASRYPGETIIIEGHTDNVPLKSVLKISEDNSNLGYQRARKVFEYLNQKGITKDRMVVVTYGFMKPVDPATQDTEEGRRLNRRVVIRRGGNSRI